MIQQLRSRGGMARRLLASVVLASVTVAFTPPPLLHEHASSQDCHRAVGARAVVTVAQAPSGGCDQMSVPACTLMVACASVAPAVLSTSLLVAIPAALDVVVVDSRSTLHGRLALGPPTPPPNS